MKRNHKIISKHSLNTKQLPRRVSYAKLRASLVACHYMTETLGTVNGTHSELTSEDIFTYQFTFDLLNPNDKIGHQIIEKIQAFGGIKNPKKQGVVIFGTGAKMKCSDNKWAHKLAVAIVSSTKTFKHGKIYLLESKLDLIKGEVNYTVFNIGLLKPMEFVCRKANIFDYVPLPEKFRYIDTAVGN